MNPHLFPPQALRYWTSFVNRKQSYRDRLRGKRARGREGRWCLCFHTKYVISFKRKNLSASTYKRGSHFFYVKLLYVFYPSFFFSNSFHIWDVSKRIKKNNSILTIFGLNEIVFNYKKKIKNQDIRSIVFSHSFLCQSTLTNYAW